jgi:hypothetical protein
MCCKVGPRQREVEDRVPLRLVHRVKQLFGYASVPRLKGSLLRLLVILPVKSTVAPAIHPIFLLHVFLHGEENARAEFSPLASSRGVVAEFVRIVFFLVDLLAIPLAFLV